MATNDRFIKLSVIEIISPQQAPLRQSGNGLMSICRKMGAGACYIYTAQAFRRLRSEETSPLGANVPSQDMVALSGGIPKEQPLDSPGGFVISSIDRQESIPVWLSMTK